MSTGEKSFTLYLSGAADNDIAVMNYLAGQKEYRDVPCAVFKLNYTAPYQNFTAIREFQCAMRYHPFADKAWRGKVAVVDLSEWVGHEKEDYLEIFCKFLHDFRSFFQLEYVFTVGAADRDAVQGLYRLISEYLCEGRLVEDNTLTDSRALGRLLKENYPLDEAVAEKLAEIFTAGQIRGLTQLHTVMEDFLARMDLAEGRRVRKTKAVLQEVSKLNFLDLAQVLPAVLVGSAVLGAAWRLFRRAPGWLQRTLVLAAALAVQWTVAPLAAALSVYLLRQLPLLFLFLMVLACLLRPHHFL